MIEFKLPSLGADMDDGTLIEWKVSPGQEVHKGDVVAIVDTTKAAVDLECWVEGRVHELITQPGEKIATIVDPGVEVRVNNSVVFDVSGTLSMQGTAAQPVRLRGNTGFNAGWARIVVANGGLITNLQVRDLLTYTLSLPVH